MNRRVIAYIDGFNLYYGLRTARWKRFYWLNLQLLVRNILKADQELVFTKYFTSRVSYPADKERRQSAYLEAWETLNDLRIMGILISADSDLTAPVLSIKRLFPDKRIIIAFPPRRHSAQLERLAHGSLQIGRATLAKSVFPEKVAKADGFILQKPPEWE